MSELREPVGTSDHIQGAKEDFLVTLVEYGDYQCSFCARAHPIVKSVQKALGDDLRFVFRNFPLSTIHAHAQNAAEAAEIAGTFGKFWEMHDVLFEHQNALGDHHLAQFAEDLGIDRTLFVKSLEDHDQEPRVRHDFSTGARSGVNGTPTFFINGTRYDDSWEHGALLRALKQAIG